MYSRINLVSYLLLCLFVISFLVFLNSTQPFVLTDILGDADNIGDKVGSLAFADEIVSICLCPLWGSLSDKVGTRPVGVVGLFIISISLYFYTAGKSVYPDLLMLRIVFAIGTSACVSMIPAMLGEVSWNGYELIGSGEGGRGGIEESGEGGIEGESDGEGEGGQGGTDESAIATDKPSNSKLSGLVGMITGIGAVLAVSVFLPLPTWLDKTVDHSDGKASLQKAYYIVATVALVTASLLFIGLHKDSSKSFKTWSTSTNDSTDSLSYFETIKMGFYAANDKQIALSYVGGFVARSATVALTLFVPLSVNIYFYEQHICKIGDVHDSLPNVKKGCHEAYVLAAILTGIANTVSLIFAPIWGLLGDYMGQHIALMISSVIGFIGCIGFAFIDRPNSAPSFIMACFLGAGQIGAIVLSMSMCTNVRKQQYKGSIAGVYSLSGGLGILLITKLGGYLSDIWKGTPFIILASFYFILITGTIWALPRRN